MNRTRSLKLKTQNIDELGKMTDNETDKEWIKKVSELCSENSKYFDSFQFNLAAERLYEFIWHEFADKYIEDVKNRIDERSFTILSSLFAIQLKLLHPIIPFITEELYRKFEPDKSIMIERWPQ
jgi:valyl-tRNA synthetase